jgi:adenylate kinase
MIIALSGTPGTGKTSIAKILAENGFEIVDLNNIACGQGFLIGHDDKRDSDIVDVNGLNNYIHKNYQKKDVIFVEGHLSHLLKCADKVIVLRCHPDKLRGNLSKKGWKDDKINENIEAEALDIILCEAVDLYSEKKVIEIDVTSKSIDNVASLIIKLVKDEFKDMKKYKIGNIDWSEEILKDF